VASSDLSREHQIGSTKEPWRRVLPFLGLGNLLSLVTIISSLCALLFLVRPTLKPREEVGATIDKVKLERDVTLREFLDRTGLVFHGPDANLIGLVIYAQVNLHGLPDSRYAIWCKVLDAANESAVLPMGITEHAEVTETFSPQAPADKVVLRAWIAQPLPVARRVVGPGASLAPLVESDRLKVRVELYDVGGHGACRATLCGQATPRLLDVVDSRPFPLQP
jgi:hypothetical protein